MSAMSVQITAETTPNPQSMRFKVDRTIADRNEDIANIDAAAVSPLATKLFGFPWTQAVFIGTDFITITKQDWVDWTILSEPLCGLLKEHLDSGEAVLLDPQANDEKDNDSDDVRLIKRILDREIRPQVALDGGDIVFQRYEDNIVYLHMKGACSGCPSSTITLKQGIEVRLMQALPSIKEVVSI